MLYVTAGKVPGGVADIEVPEGTTLLEAVREAARVDGESRGLGRPSFDIAIGDYELKGQNTVDVPQVNGKFHADYDGVTQRWENIRWDDICENGDVVLVIPKVQGAQFIVSVTMDGWDESRKVAVFEPGDPEGGSDAGTVKQALAAAGVKVAENDIIVVNDGEEVYPAGLDEHLCAGAEIYVHASGYEFAPSTTPEPTEAEVLAVAGTDPQQLRYEADDCDLKAADLRTKAGDMLAEAIKLEAKAKACDAKADAIDSACTEYETAKARLQGLGVFHTYSKAELETMSAKTLRALIREKGVKPSAMMRKADLVKWALALQ